MFGKLLTVLSGDRNAEDPVCHMSVPIKSPGGGVFEHQGTTYYFCGPGCRIAFSKEPAEYLSGNKSLDM
jgi:Cu+-exporting ATPase